MQFITTCIFVQTLEVAQNHHASPTGVESQDLDLPFLCTVSSLQRHSAKMRCAGAYSMSLNRINSLTFQRFSRVPLRF